jgi:hypothetical protein
MAKVAKSNCKVGLVDCGLVEICAIGQKGKKPQMLRERNI